MVDKKFNLKREETGLLIVDVQEKLFRLVDRTCDTLAAIKKVADGFRILHLPTVITEQYPQGLGATVKGVLDSVNPDIDILPKTAFSCLGDDAIRSQLLAMPVKQWVVAGIEAHVCILQTARDLLREGKQVIVLNDAISSRSIFDYSTAIAELRDMGARISSTETVLYELLQDAKAKEFKEILSLVK